MNPKPRSPMPRQRKASMDKQAEERIERRLRQLFSDGMPKTAVDDAGLQTRGSFLRERPASPFRSLHKRARVEVGTCDTGEGEGEGNEGERQEKEEITNREEVGVRETVREDVKTDTTDCSTLPHPHTERPQSPDGPSGSSSASASASVGSEDSEEAEDDSGEGDGEATEEVGEERRRVFRRLVETNRQYRERLLRG